MDIRQCPRCQNSEIIEDANFCQICGLDLRKKAADTTTAIHSNAFGHSENGVVYYPKELNCVPKP